jgi:hypothetical protein
VLAGACADFADDTHEAPGMVRSAGAGVPHHNEWRHWPYSVRADCTCAIPCMVNARAFERCERLLGFHGDASHHAPATIRVPGLCPKGFVPRWFDHR